MQVVRLNNLNDNPGARRKRKRVGRGIGSGKGKTAGRGVKGQKSRSGVAIKGFEGGQMPIHMRLPKRGFNKPNRKRWAELSIATLNRAIQANKLDLSKDIDAVTLVQAGVIRRAYDGVRLIGSGNLNEPIRIIVTATTKGAHQSILNAGGNVRLLSEVKKKYKQLEREIFLANLTSNKIGLADFDESGAIISDVEDLFYSVMERLEETPISLTPVASRLKFPKAKIKKYLDEYDRVLERSQIAQQVNLVVVPQVIGRDKEQVSASLKILSLTSIFDQDITPKDRSDEVERVTNVLKDHQVPCVIVAKHHKKGKKSNIELDISYSLNALFETASTYSGLLSNNDTRIYISYLGNEGETKPPEEIIIQPSREFQSLSIDVPVKTTDVLLTVGHTMREIKIT